MNAPVALFAYKRLSHLQRTVESLINNPDSPETDMIVFSDAAKTVADVAAVGRVREYIRTIRGVRNLRIVDREEHCGLAHSLISGISEVLSEYANVIVLEDDMVVAPSFLAYMNQALSMYEHDSQVASIHGYVYPSEKELPETFFIRGADCWGWATWKRGWRLFRNNGSELLQEIRERNLESVFDFDGAYPYTSMLESQIAGRVDSWAIRWYASVFLWGGLTLYPGRSLVRNIGIDGSGTHCSSSSAWESGLAQLPVRVERIAVEENPVAKKLFIEAMRAVQRKPEPAQRRWRRFFRKVPGKRE
jgi:hypothetical protein